MTRHALGTPANAWFVDKQSADITRPALNSCPTLLETHTKTLRLDLAKSAMIIIDMQNDFCHLDGWLASIGVDVAPARQPIEPLQGLLPQLRLAQV